MQCSVLSLLLKIITVVVHGEEFITFGGDIRLCYCMMIRWLSRLQMEYAISPVLRFLIEFCSN